MSWEGEGGVCKCVLLRGRGVGCIKERGQEEEEEKDDEWRERRARKRWRNKEN
jgi:hypothetical protein